MGPTAVGKTALSIHLAQHYTTEILSADSRQFYKELEVGTAKPSEEELKSVKHHFIGHRSIHEPYNASQYETDSLALLKKLFKKHDVVIMVGGSGLYIQAALHGLDNVPASQPKIRQKLIQMFEFSGIEILQEQLKDKDPKYYKTVDLNNPHRLIRALEVCMETGKPYSSFLDTDPIKKKERSFFVSLVVGLDMERDTLYEIINERVDQMMENGLLEEAKELYSMKGLNALDSVGYKELFELLDGTIDIEEAVERIKRNSRRYAKRQLTWFKEKEETRWFKPGEEKKVLAYLKKKT